MTFALILVAVGLLAVTALGAGLLQRSNRAALGVASAGAVAASGLGLAASLLALVERRSESLAMGFSTALGPVEVGLDPLSAFFLVCVFTVSGLAAAYGNGYMRVYLASRRGLGPRP
jgi:hydrogenase-4 component B